MEIGIKGKFYFKDGVSNEYSHFRCLHREDGPSIEWLDGAKEWYVNGILHNVNGPCKSYPDGSHRWGIDGEMYPEEEFKRVIKEIKEMDEGLRLLDPRWWVREWK
jgi:hypothetical protein